MTTKEITGKIWGDLGSDLRGDLEGDRDDCLAAHSVPMLHCEIDPFLTFSRQD